jgi:hypothetical protein
MSDVRVYPVSKGGLDTRHISGILTHSLSSKGGDSPCGEKWNVEALAGAGGFRQGAIQINVNRASGESVTWDGNPDCGLKIIVTNRAANAANEGATRALDVQARNRGTNASWCNAINANVRNDSGKTAYILTGQRIRCENYGTVETELVGIDVELSCENDTGAPLKYGVRVRNTDASGMGAADAALHVSHTSTNGFAAFAHLATAVGDGAVGSTTTPTGAATEALIVKIGTNLRYIPCYAAVGFGG